MPRATTRAEAVSFCSAEPTPIQRPTGASHLLGDTWEHVTAADPNVGPHGLTMSVTPTTLKYNTFISVDFSLPAPQATPIQLTLIVGNFTVQPEIPAMSTSRSVKINVDDGVIPQAPLAQVPLDVVAHVDDRVLRQTIHVAPQ